MQQSGIIEILSLDMHLNCLGDQISTGLNSFRMYYSSGMATENDLILVELEWEAILFICVLSHYVV